MFLAELFQEALHAPPSAIAYHVSRKLAEVFPGRAILEGDACEFRVEDYAEANLCAIDPEPTIHNQFTTSWSGDGKSVTQATNAWFEVTWRGHLLDVVLLEWDCCNTRHWIIAETQEVAQSFYAEVCSWNPEIADEVLVFEGGYWTASESLFEAIQSATFENLVLAGSLKHELRDDLTRFFASKDLYEIHGIPWKRGILLIGPPGNGKTHAVKALIHEARQPCLYVKTFACEYLSVSTNIRSVFQYARRTAPCLLVLEDLDALIDDANRSVFLNELDGFAENRGIVILATTNHPEKLDPAIIERPSRFDRKYHFELPGPVERRQYLALWNGSLRSALQLSSEGIECVAARTEGFSFAYLKELVLSSMMRWVADAEPGAMEAVMLEQADALRAQMCSAASEPAPAAPEPSETE